MMLVVDKCSSSVGLYTSVQYEFDIVFSQLQHFLTACSHVCEHLNIVYIQGIEIQTYVHLQHLYSAKYNHIAKNNELSQYHVPQH